MKRKKVLIFGGTGSLGKTLIRRMLNDSDVAVYSRDEEKHWTIRNEYASHSAREGLNFFVGDIRDKNRVVDVLRQYRPETIIVAAALKQVDTCELSPNESVLTNLIGTQNVVDAVNTLPDKVETVLFVSTDKACAPVNVYGMCKAISERVVTSQSRTGHDEIRYLAVRYGNVLESRGSIIPLFKYQAKNNAHLTVTDPAMTRYLMTLDDSVDLIEHALESGNSGETWIPRLPSMRIGDLAELFSEKYQKPVKIVGLRPGEKMHESLINASESVRTREYGMFRYVISPAHETGKGKMFEYTSADKVMTKDQLEEYLQGLDIFDRDLSTFPSKNIEEIRTA